MYLNNKLTIIICLFCLSCDAMTNLTELNQDLSDISLLSGIENITEMDEMANPVGNIDEDDWQCQGPSGMVSPGFYPAYPNPFTFSVNLSYVLYRTVYVSIIVIDSNAEVVANIMSDFVNPGTYSLIWSPFVGVGANSLNITGEGGTEPGYYRIQMTTPDFECYGDVHYNP